MTRRKNYPTEQKTMRSAAMLLAGISLFMTFFIALWSWNNPAGFIGYIGIDPSALKIPGAWILAAAAAVGYIVCTARMIPTVCRNLFRFKGALKWIAIYAAFTGGIVEETVFRRMLMEWLADNGTNTLWQIGISGLAFGLVHISWGCSAGFRASEPVQPWPPRFWGSCWPLSTWLQPATSCPPSRHTR